MGDCLTEKVAAKFSEMFHQTLSSFALKAGCCSSKGSRLECFFLTFQRFGIRRRLLEHSSTVCHSQQKRTAKTASLFAVSTTKGRVQETQLCGSEVGRKAQILIM